MLQGQLRARHRVPHDTKAGGVQCRREVAAPGLDQSRRAAWNAACCLCEDVGDFIERDGLWEGWQKGHGGIRAPEQN
jgi:hypothetical protein